jgi:hypothetical protein
MGFVQDTRYYKSIINFIPAFLSKNKTHKQHSMIIMIARSSQRDRFKVLNKRSGNCPSKRINIMQAALAYYFRCGNIKAVSAMPIFIEKPAVAAVEYCANYYKSRICRARI